MDARTISSRLFVGASGTDIITFGCLDDGGYAILRGDQCVGTWDLDELDDCVEAYLELIERPMYLHSDSVAAAMEFAPLAPVRAAG